MSCSGNNPTSICRSTSHFEDAAKYENKLPNDFLPTIPDFQDCVDELY